MVKLSECTKRGLRDPAIKLIERMRNRYKGFATFDGSEDMQFSKKEVKDAIQSFGINLGEMKGKKWYEFKKNNWDEKIYNSLQAINKSNGVMNDITLLKRGPCSAAGFSKIYFAKPEDFEDFFY